MTDIKQYSKITYRTTDEERKLDRFFMENDLEYSDEHPVDTDRIMMWEAVCEEGSREEGSTAGDLAGGLALALRQGEYIIDGIAVDEKYRGRNVGGRLLELAIRESIGRGAERIYLVARAPEFFRHFGFETVERKDAPEFFECLTCPQYGVSCHPEVMCLRISE